MIKNFIKNKETFMKYGIALILSLLFSVSVYAQTPVYPLGKWSDGTNATFNNSTSNYAKKSVSTRGGQFVENSTGLVSFTYGSLAFGAVSTTYETIVTNTSKVAAVDCYNGLDVGVIFSIDASTSGFYIPPSTGKIYPLKTWNLYMTSNLSVKSVSATASGSVFCTLTLNPT